MQKDCIEKNFHFLQKQHTRRAIFWQDVPPTITPKDMTMSTQPLPCLHFDIDGMHCAACSARIERVLGRRDDVERVSVNLATRRARVSPREGIDAQKFGAGIVEAVAALGFTATPAADDDPAALFATAQAKELADLATRKRRLIPMACLVFPLLLLSMGHMLGLRLPAVLDPHTSPRAFMLAQLALTLPVVWLGRHFYRDGASALARKSPTMDSLVALGTGAAFLYSLCGTLLGLVAADPTPHAMNLYYESCAMLLTMIELGQMLEATAKRRAGEAMSALLRLTPPTALKLDPASPDLPPQEISLSSVVPGDILLLRPGERAPVDGEVLDGKSAVDFSLLTGESVPVAVGPGHKLPAGCLNGEGSLTLRTEAVGSDTRLAHIVRLVREAQGSKAPIARLADRVSFHFVPAVMALALFSALAWLVCSDEPVSTALTVFVAVLVMACPCAMGLATPMSILVGTGRGAQLGVLIRNGAALEQTSRINALAVDKTGTLTTGRPALTGIDVLDGMDEKSLLTLACALETRSEHPLAAAIVRAGREQNLPSCPVEDVVISPGLGIAGRVLLDHTPHTVALGNAAFMAERGIALSPQHSARLESLARAGKTPLLLALGQGAAGRLAAIFSLADSLRPESASVVRQLQRMGMDVVMLTGDNEHTARAVAGEMRLHVAAGLLPEEKAAYVRRLQDQGKIVGMVGDGINDAPALAAAHVGMAVGTGVDVSAEAGDIVLMRGGMEAVLTALALSRATMRNIRQNLLWAFGYNILGLPVAAGLLHAFGGPMLSPMLAGTAMALSSFSVVSNALRLRFWSPEK